MPTLLKTIVTVPTYNEAENIGALVDAILALEVPGHELHALVIDDDSPDGTARVAEERAKRNPRAHLLLRTRDKGRGLAGAEGFQWALRAGAQRIVEMDADFSHDPRSIPALLDALRGKADIASGSRFVAGGKDVDRGWGRQALTLCAGVYIRAVLGLGLRDASSGFRAYTRQALERLEPQNFISSGPSIVQEVFFRAAQRRLRVQEVPILFLDRKLGRTKLNAGTLLKVLGTVAKLRLLQMRGELFENGREQKTP